MVTAGAVVAVVPEAASVVVVVVGASVVDVDASTAHELTITSSMTNSVDGVGRLYTNTEEPDGAAVLARAPDVATYVNVVEPVTVTDLQEPS